MLAYCLLRCAMPPPRHALLPLRDILLMRLVTPLLRGALRDVTNAVSSLTRDYVSAMPIAVASCITAIISAVH